MAFARILKAELDVVEPRFHKLGQTLARKPDSRSDQVRVQTRLARPRDQFSQIGTRQRLASGEVEMQNAERGASPKTRSQSAVASSSLRDVSSSGFEQYTQCSGQRCVISAIRASGLALNH